MSFSSSFLGSVAGTLQVDLTKDRLTGKKGLLHMHREGRLTGNPNPKDFSDLEAYLPFKQKGHKFVEK